MALAPCLCSLSLLQNAIWEWSDASLMTLCHWYESTHLTVSASNFAQYCNSCNSPTGAVCSSAIWAARKLWLSHSRLGVCCRWRGLSISGVFLRIESECVRSTPTLMGTTHKLQKFTALYLSGHCPIWGIRGTKEKHISTFQTFTAFPLGLFLCDTLKLWSIPHSDWTIFYSLAKQAQSLFCCFCCSGFFVISWIMHSWSNFGRWAWKAHHCSRFILFVDNRLSAHYC